MQYNLFGYCLGRSLINSIFNTSFLIRGYGYDNYRHSNYFYGPSREYIQRYAGRMINPVHIRDYNRPGQSYANGYLNLYRPQMQRGNSFGRQAAPRTLNNNMAGRNIQNNYRANVIPNRNVYSTGRNIQAQQPIQNSYRSQGVQQPSHYTNSGFQGRGVQTAQQPTQNSYRSQGVQNPTRYAVANNQGRSAQPAYQQRNQREERAVQNVQSNNRQQGSRVSSSTPAQRSQPSSSQREGNLRGSSNNDRGRR
jgi:hypothetical protein